MTRDPIVAAHAVTATTIGAGSSGRGLVVASSVAPAAAADTGVNLLAKGERITLKTVLAVTRPTVIYVGRRPIHATRVAATRGMIASINVNIAVTAMVASAAASPSAL